MLQLLCLTGAALMLGATPAHADPISLTIAGINALLGTTLAASTVIVGTLTVGQAIGAALAVGGSLLASALGGAKKGGGNAPIDPAAGKNLFETAESGEIRAIGKVRVAGVKGFGNTAGLDRLRLIMHSRGPVDGVEEHYLGGREVIVEPNGIISSPPYAVSSVSSWVQLAAKPGGPDETSWDAIKDRFPDLWTPEHRVRGIAQTLALYISPGLTDEFFLKLYQSGPPEYERVQRGELLYDPRDGGTRWSDNGVLAVLHVMLGLPDFEFGDFDLPFIAAEANRADQLVETRTGFEPRSRCWGLWDDFATNRGDLLREILLSTGTEIVTRPGDRFGIRLVEDNAGPELVFATRHLQKLTLKAGPDGVERPNRCRVKYYSPERNYDMAEVNLVLDPDLPGSPPPAWSVAQDEIDRVGERSVEYSLPFCPSAAQAQRIARRLFSVARADTGIATLNMTGLAAWGCRRIGITPPDLDEMLTCEIQPARVDDQSGTVEIPFVVLPALAPWNPASDEALPPDELPEIGQEIVISRPAMPSAVYVVDNLDGSFETRLVYDLSGITRVEASYQLLDGRKRTEWRSMTAHDEGGTSYASVPLDLGGLPARWRVRIFNDLLEGSIWSPVLEAAATIAGAPPP